MISCPVKRYIYTIDSIFTNAKKNIIADFNRNIVSNRKFFKDYKLHSPYRLVQIFVVFEQFASACLIQIALEII